MSEIDDGGSAFPHPTSPQIKGMTLRDWFAGQALIGVVSHDAHRFTSGLALAQRAYLLADAMIAEGKKKDGTE